MNFKIGNYWLFLTATLLLSGAIPVAAQITQSPNGQGTVIKDGNNQIVEPNAEIEKLWQLGEQQYQNSQFIEAIATYEQILSLYLQIGDRVGEAEALERIGTMHDFLGEYSQALEVYQQALTIKKEHGDRAGEGSLLNSIGNIYYQQGEYDQALNFYQQVLEIRKEVGDLVGEGRTLNNIGLVYNSWGQYPQAIEYFEQALKIVRVASNFKGIGASLNNLGLVYSQLGQYDRAFKFYQQALVVRRFIADNVGIGTTLHNMGLLYDQQKQYKLALKLYQQALAVRQGANDKAGEGITINNIGLAYNQLGDRAQALQFLQQALKIFQEIGDRASEGNTFDSLGTVYKSLGNYQQSLNSYQQALTIVKELGNRDLERLVLSNIAQLLEIEQKPELAVFFYKQSINLTETIRQDLKKLPREQQQSYTETVADSYRKLANLLLQQDRVLEAQQVLDLLKIQELDNYLHDVRGNEKTSKGVDLLPPEEKVEKDYNDLQNKAIKFGKELTKIRNIPEASRTPEQQKKLAELQAFQRELRQEFNQFINSPTVKALINQLNKTTNGENINLEILNKLQAQLKRLQQNAVFLYPLVLEDRIELVLVTADSPPIHRPVAINRQDVNQAIATFRTALQNPNSDAKIPAQKLYNLLIKPIAVDLEQAGAQTIIYAPDGQLRYIPLGALHDGEQWLTQRFRINNITALSLTDLDIKPSDKPHLLAAAFTEGRYTFKVKNNEFTFAGLPFAGQEVEKLATMVPETTKLLDRNFSRAATIDRMNDYNIVHLATHAAFVLGQPEESFILFGDGDRVTLRDIATWSLPDVDLIVLSACETGVGGQLGNGEEILGFGYQMQKTGARAAVASLWAVSDGGTQALMSAFYTALAEGKLTKANALHQAQIALITGNYQALGSARGGVAVEALISSKLPDTVAQRLSHPYYWAPFILIGNGL